MEKRKKQDSSSVFSNTRKTQMKNPRKQQEHHDHHSRIMYSSMSVWQLIETPQYPPGNPILYKSI
jgi:hypothetical protein